MTKIKLILLTAIKTIIYFIFFFALLNILGFVFGYNILDILTDGHFDVFNYKKSTEDGGFKRCDMFYPFIVLPFVLTFLWIFRKLWIFIFRKIWQWFSFRFGYEKRYINIIKLLILCSLIVFSGWNINKIVKIHQLDCEEWIVAIKKNEMDCKTPPYSCWADLSLRQGHEECIAQKQGLKDRYLSLFFGDVIILLTGISISRLVFKRRNAGKNSAGTNL